MKTKEISCKIFKTPELWLVWSLERHKPEAVGFCLDLSSIIHGVSSKRTPKEPLKNPYEPRFEEWMPAKDNYRDSARRAE